MTDYLYPSLDDIEFNNKLASKKEFNDTQYDDYDLKKVEEESDRLCNMKMELSSHQIFVRNFLSNETPYKGLLLYHGLGTGKTCSAITICEEFRLSALDVSRIMIIASKNVQDNFKIQLFDERKLELVHGLWNITGCVSQSLVNEINPTSMKNIPKDRVVHQINALISKHYHFMGYRQFSNFVTKKVLGYQHITDIDARKKRVNRFLKQMFSNRLMVIDEVQNIRSSKGREETESSDADEKVYQVLLSIAKVAKNLKLVLMSATPMYDTYEEIIALINLLNANDKRSRITRGDIFEANGDFKQGGKELFAQKITGYVSVVRGENPYLFPYRIYPSLFQKEKSIQSYDYPAIDLIEQPIEPEDTVKYLDLYVNGMGEYQSKIYEKYKIALKRKIKRQLGYNEIEPGVQLLTMTYPSIEEDIDLRLHYGKQGLKRIMNFDDTTLEKKKKNEKKNYEYKQEIYDEFNRIFSLQEIGKYSDKLFQLGTHILASTGIIMIYSRYIEGGVIPIALMLEELGMKRYGNTVSLFKKVPAEPLDALTMKPRSQVTGTFHQATYAMITGDQALSNANIEETIALTNDDNKEGKLVKVVILTMAGSEGIDLKCIRQTHIIDPWYNIFRVEQLIGRSVRTCSHKLLPFKKRNVQIFLYTTLIPDQEEASDMNLYRRSHKKMIQIGKVSRVLKEHAIDCQLNQKQTNFTELKMLQSIQLELSMAGKPSIEYNVGDKQYSHVCDFMSECDYNCKPIAEIGTITEVVSMPFLVLNVDKIISRIKELFYEYASFTKSQMIKLINVEKRYPEDQINMALDKLVTDKTEFLTNAQGSQGRLVNSGEYYRFQPLELIHSTVSHFDISHPLEFKPPGKIFTLNEQSVMTHDQQDIQHILSNFKTIYTHITKKKEEDEEDTMSIWYRQANKIILLIKNQINEKMKRTDALSIFQIIGLHHYIETELFQEDHLLLLNYLQSKEAKKDTSPWLQIVKQYYEKQIFEFESNPSVVLLVDSEHIATSSIVQHVVYQLNDSSWRKKEDLGDDIINDRIRMINIKEMDYYNIIGFMYLDKSVRAKKLRVFNKKTRGKKDPPGYWCQQKGSTVLDIELSPLLNEYKIKPLGKDTGTHKCVEMELYLRYFDIIGPEDKHGIVKRYFIDPVSIVLLV